MPMVNKPPDDDEEKLTFPVAFRVSAEMGAELKAFASRERRKKNTLARLIFEVGLKQFREAGSFEAFIAEAKNPKGKGRVA